MYDKIKEKYPNPKVIFEVGCHRGGDLVTFSNMFPDAIIYGFEADPHNYKIAKELVKNNSNIKVYNIAISDIDSEINFYRYADTESIEDSSLPYGSNYQHTGVGSILLPGDVLINLFNYKVPYETLKVQSKTIKSFCKENDIESVDFLFMDIQGAEYKAFMGMGELIDTLNATVFEFSTNRVVYDQETDFNIIKVYLETHGLFEAEKTWQLTGLTGDASFIRNN